MALARNGLTLYDAIFRSLKRAPARSLDEDVTLFETGGDPHEFPIHRIPESRVTRLRKMPL